MRAQASLSFDLGTASLSPILLARTAGSLMIWFVVPDDYGKFAVRGKIVFLSAQAHRYVPPTEVA